MKQGSDIDRTKRRYLYTIRELVENGARFNLKLLYETFGEELTDCLLSHKQLYNETIELFREENNAIELINLHELNLLRLEKSAILKALEKAKWSQKKAANLLGITPRMLNYKIKNYGIINSRWRVNNGEIE